MLLKKYFLGGSCKKDFDTEIKFYLASAKYDGADFVLLSIQKVSDEVENSRLASCVSRVLNTLKKTGSVKFFVRSDQLEKNTTEAEYILNKFPSQLTVNEKYLDIYVKI